MQGKTLVMVKLRNNVELNIFMEDQNELMFINGLELSNEGTCLVTSKCLNFDDLSEDEQMANGMTLHEEYPADVIMNTVFIEPTQFDQYIKWRNHFVKLRKEEREAAENSHPLAGLMSGLGGGPLPMISRIPIDDPEDPENDDTPKEENPELQN